MHSVRDTLRRIALNIIRERRQAGTRVFVVTAVGEGAGTSSLTLALATELTELDASTVAVEANVRSSDIRFHKQPADGLGHIPASADELEQHNGRNPDNVKRDVVAKRNPLDLCVHTIINASDSLPDRIAICQYQRHERLAMMCVQEVLELALRNHDVALVDAPPILGSADTSMLVHRPAGVIVVVQAGRDRIPDVTAAIQELSRSSPPVIGIVVRGDRWDVVESNSRAQGEHQAMVASTSEKIAEVSMPHVATANVPHLS
jgi:Mrp family chromosome partitioning ATPase